MNLFNERREESNREFYKKINALRLNAECSVLADLYIDAWRRLQSCESDLLEIKVIHEDFSSRSFTREEIQAFADNSGIYGVPHKINENSQECFIRILDGMDRNGLNTINGISVVKDISKGFQNIRKNYFYNSQDGEYSVRPKTPEDLLGVIQDKIEIYRREINTLADRLESAVKSSRKAASEKILSTMGGSSGVLKIRELRNKHLALLNTSDNLSVEDQDKICTQLSLLSYYSAYKDKARILDNIVIPNDPEHFKAWFRKNRYCEMSYFGAFPDKVENKNGHLVMKDLLHYKEWKEANENKPGSTLIY